MKKTRKLLSILLALVMALSLCTVAFAVDDPEVPVFSGTCGEDIAWTVEGGVLTVTGTGAIEPLVRQVWDEQATYVDGYEDPETHDWVDGYWEPGYVDDDYFPWEEEVMAYFYGLNGAENEEEFYTLLMNGEIPVGEAMNAFRNLLSKIVIGEGITSIADNAFNDFQAAEIELPATLTTLGSTVFDLQFTTSVTMKNAAFDFEENEIMVWGGVGYPEIATTSLEDYIAQTIAEQGALLTILPLFYAFESAAMLSSFDIDSYVEYLTEMYSEYVQQGYMTEEEMQAYIDQAIGEMSEEILGMVSEYFPRFTDAVPETVEDAVAILLDFFNEKYGNEEEGIVFESLADIAIFDPEEENYTIGEKFAEAAPVEAALIEEFMGGGEDDGQSLVEYRLGTAPLKEVYEDGAEEPTVVAITPVPWLTVYGPYNSTAKTACATSQVKFVSFEEQEFDAYKADAAAAAAAKAADGDSDASKKLISDAQAAINALAYDGTKTLAENKAAVDAINAKLDTDLAAQREADAAQPEEPTTEKPEEKPADNDKDEDGGYSNNAFMKFIKKIIEFFKGIFDKITGIFKK